MTDRAQLAALGGFGKIPDSCGHGGARQVKPLKDCPRCGGSGRVTYESDEYPPGTNACCCTCSTCRARYDDTAAVATLGAHIEQPAPSPGTGDVWQEVIDGEPLAVLRELYEARRALGLRRYGHLLQRDNGRDHALDGQEELLDGIAYFTAAGWYDVVAALRTALLCVVARRGAA